MTDQTNLAPDALGPTLCIGEILAEIVATSTGEGFLDPVPMVGPYPSGAARDLYRSGGAHRGIGCHGGVCGQ